MAKTTLKIQLFKRLFLLMILMALIAVSGIVVTSVLKKTSNRIVFEYIELNAVQELRLAFNKTFIPAYNYLIYHETDELEHFKARLDSTHWHLEHCRTILSKTHSRDLLANFEQSLNYFEHMVVETGTVNFDVMENRKLIPLLDDLIDHATEMIEVIIHETKHEIDEYIILNATAVKHSSATIIILSVLVILLGFIIGSLFVRQIVQPLKKLVLTTHEVAGGNLEVEVLADSDNELDELADSFNHMVNTLRLTTVSRNLFNNILSNMQELLVVIDNAGEIVLVNNATNKMLGYNNEELKGKPVDILFQDDGFFKKDSMLKIISSKNIESEYVTKSGSKIPIFLSYTELGGITSETSGFIMVASDISEKKNIERNIELNRRKTIVDLNDAQEKERLRIAKDLHDGLGQMLTGISYYIENNFSEQFKSDDVYSKKIETIQSQIDATIRESKIIAYDLIPMQLKDFGLSAAISNLVERLNIQQKTRFGFSEFNITARLDEKLEKVLFRIVQEATNNIVKHAKAATAQIQLINHDKSVSLIIVDDGIGFDFNRVIHDYKKKGLGLTSIQERVDSFNGFLNVTSSSGNGTEILIEIVNE
jgi:PAS domain S-box-containing protein